MSTKACLYTLDYDNNKFIATAVNFDGYLDYTGKILQEKYQNSDKVTQLITGGEIRTLDKNGTPEYYDETYQTFDSAEALEKEYDWCDHIYFYSSAANGWYYKDPNDRYLQLT